MTRLIVVALFCSLSFTGNILGQEDPKELDDKELLQKYGDEVASLWGPLLKQRIKDKGGKEVELRSGFVFRGDNAEEILKSEDFWQLTESRMKGQKDPTNALASVKPIREAMDKAANQKFGRSGYQLLKLLFSYQETRERYFLTEKDVQTLRPLVQQGIDNASKVKISAAQYERYHLEKGYLNDAWVAPQAGQKLKD